MVRWRRGVGNVSVSPTSRCLEQGMIVFAVIKDGRINQQKILFAQNFSGRQRQRHKVSVPQKMYSECALILECDHLSIILNKNKSYKFEMFVCLSLWSLPSCMVGIPG